MHHRKWRETRQQQSRFRLSYQCSCCLVSLCFLCENPEHQANKYFVLSGNRLGMGLVHQIIHGGPPSARALLLPEWGLGGVPRWNDARGRGRHHCQLPDRAGQGLCQLLRGANRSKSIKIVKIRLKSTPQKLSSSSSSSFSTDIVSRNFTACVRQHYVMIKSHPVMDGPKNDRKTIPMLMSTY